MKPSVSTIRVAAVSVASPPDATVKSGPAWRAAQDCNTSLPVTV